VKRASIPRNGRAGSLLADNLQVELRGKGIFESLRKKISIVDNDDFKNIVRQLLLRQRLQAADEKLWASVSRDDDGK